LSTIGETYLGGAGWIVMTVVLGSAVNASPEFPKSALVSAESSTDSQLCAILRIIRAFDRDYERSSGSFVGLLQISDEL